MLDVLFSRVGWFMRIHNFPVTHSSFFVPKGQYCSISSTSKNLNSQFHMLYIYISMVSMWQFQIPNGFPKYIEETIWTIAKELELPFIPPGARTFARGRGTLSPRAGRLPGASQKPSPRIPVLWMQKKHLETIPSHGGCMAVAHIHSNWGNYFHTYNFSLWFSAYSQQT